MSEINVRLSELLMDWWVEQTPRWFREKVRYVYYTPGFTCNCNRSTKLAWIKEDCVVIDHDGTTSSGSSTEILNIADPKFLDNLTDALLNKQKQCCGP
jgi:hypothetical protein